MQPISVLFFGAQGVGKGTQVKMLEDYLRSRSDRKIVHIDMGQEFRNLRDTGSFAGKLTGGVIDQGGRMPDFMAIYLQTKKLVENLTGEEHVVADGLARGPEQTAAYDDAMNFFHRENFKIISIEIPEEETIKRLLARGRNDDTEEAIRKRLAWTKTDVLPQLELLRSRGREIITIDGQPSIEGVHRDVLAKLGLS